MKTQQLDQVADKLRLEYCAKLGVPALRGWSDIQLERVREYWRDEARKSLKGNQPAQRRNAAPCGDAR